MDLKLWEYIFEMFNYKIRQIKKNDFLKITNPYPALKGDLLSLTTELILLWKIDFFVDTLMYINFIPFYNL